MQKQKLKKNLKIVLDDVTFTAYVCYHVARREEARGTDTSRTAARLRAAEAEPEKAAGGRRKYPTVHDNLNTIKDLRMQDGGIFVSE